MVDEFVANNFEDNAHTRLTAFSSTTSFNVPQVNFTCESLKHVSEEYLLVWKRPTNTADPLNVFRAKPFKYTLTAIKILHITHIVALLQRFFENTIWSSIVQTLHKAHPANKSLDVNSAHGGFEYVNTNNPFEFYDRSADDENSIEISPNFSQNCFEGMRLGNSRNLHTARLASSLFFIASQKCLCMADARSA